MRTRAAGRALGGALVSWALVIVVAALASVWLWYDVDRARDGQEVALHDPWALSLLAGAALAAWCTLHLRVRRAPTLVFSRVDDLARVPAGAVTRLSALPHALRVCSLAILAVALARPQTYRNTNLQVEGIDIMLVLDLSRSMQEHDLRRDRLDAGQRTIRRFLHRRDHDRVGLVVFAEQAVLQCPLTYDYRSLDRIVADLRIGDVPAMGTAIGDGLGLALASLRRSEQASKVIVLVSDGDSNIDAEMDPFVAKQIAIELGVKVFTILMGHEAAGEAAGDSRYAVNPALLREIAADTGGMYFHAGDDRALEASFRAVRATLDKARHTITGVAHGELFDRFVQVALVLLLVEIVLVFTRWRRFP